MKLTDAAKYFKELPHQVEALDWLQSKTSQEVMDEFTVKYRNSKEDFPNTWQGVVEAAQKAGAKFPECVAAQWYLESAQGKHTACTKNYFGIKSTDGEGCYVETKEVYNGKTVTIKDWFKAFETLYDCVDYLVTRWYKDYKSYKGVNRANSRNECARLLQTEGYATDPDYSTKLIQIMDRMTGVSGEPSSEKILNVPYEYQLDNKSGTGYRECFSSTCAMIARYYGKVKNDDEYNKIRSQYGDTTNKDAQLKALRSLGLIAKFVTNGNSALLEQEINAGRPIAVGWLHKGSVSYPTGGGHWTCCIGYTPESFVFHDPNGEADMLKGGYVSNSQKAGTRVKYSRKNWLRRWECDGQNTGWAILVSK